MINLFTNLGQVQEAYNTDGRKEYRIQVLQHKMRMLTEFEEVVIKGDYE